MIGAAGMVPVSRLVVTDRPDLDNFLFADHPPKTRLRLPRRCYFEASTLRPSGKERVWQKESIREHSLQ